MPELSYLQDNESGSCLQATWMSLTEKETVVFEEYEYRSSDCFLLAVLALQIKR